jgi:thioredoxin 1
MKATIEANETNFKSVVLQSPQPVLVDFWAAWCGPCKMIAPVLEEIAREQAGRVCVAKVNVDENARLAEQYHIQSIPTLLFFKNGLVHDHIIGVTGKKDIVSRLNGLAQRHEPSRESAPEGQADIQRN